MNSAQRTENVGVSHVGNACDALIVTRATTENYSAATTEIHKKDVEPP